MKSPSRPLRILATLVFSAAWAMIALPASTFAAAVTDPSQAKANLAAVRGRITELTQRRGKDLAERDALSSHLRDAELEVTAKRQALEELRGAAAAAAQ